MAATHTTYYNLNKPDRQDFVSVVTDINDNMDKIDTALHGKASLDGSGKVPASELPSYVDDVIEGYLYNGQFYKEAAHTTLITPEGDKIYVDIPTSSSYRWSGSLYVKIDDPKEIIDDNAGIGDTDLVYSADKVVKLFRSENEDLTSGNAEQVIGKVASTEKGAYLYRRGMHLGNRCREKVVGGTVAWNQQVTNGNFTSSTGWSYGGGISSISVNNNKLTATVTGSANADIRENVDIPLCKHKYLLLATVSATGDCIGKNLQLRLYNSGYSDSQTDGVGICQSNETKHGIIINCNKEFSWYRLLFGIHDGSSTISGTFTVSCLQLFDLTAMFGSVIADTLYGMGEAGVQWFRNLFPKDYYAYDAGTLMSVQAASKQTVGFNVWDEEWELGAWDATTGAAWSVTDRIRSKNFIPCLPSMNYFYNKPDGHKSRVLFYNAQKEYLGEYVSYDYLDTFTTPSNCYYFRFNTGGTYGTTYKNDICFNIYNPAKNGTYEPYISHTYPFDTSLVLRGIPKLDSNNRLYYDGDEYESSGKVTRKYGIVDLGTLTWTKTSDPYPTFISDGIVGTVYTSSSLSLANVVCSKYPVILASTQYSDNTDKNISLNSSKQIKIRDTSYSDAASFKTAMSGVYLVYELATPTTEQASPFTPVMSFDPEGTEEFTEWGTRDVAIPVGHITEYLTDPAKILNNIPLIEVEKESASVVTFSDGAEGLPLKELTVKVEPVQDLHGYENPWPGGGGKNLLPMTVDGIKAVNTDGTWSGNAYTDNGVTFTLNTDNAGNVISIKANGTASGYAGLNLAEPTRKTLDNFGLTIGSSYIFTKGTSNANITVIFNGSNANITATESGNTFTATTDDIYYPQIRLVNSSVSDVMIYPVLCLASASNPTTFAPYSNICPISGWTGANVNVAGFNVWDEEWENGYYSNSNGTFYSDSRFLASKNKIKVIPGSDYYFKCPANIEVFGYDVNGNYLRKICSTVQNGTQTIPSDVYFITFNSVAQNTITTYNNDICINISDSSKNGTYEAYTGNNTYHIAFPSQVGTVYGGTLTVNKDGSGSLVVDRANVDLGTLTWSAYAASLGAFTTPFSEMKNNTINALCSQYVVVSNYVEWSAGDRVFYKDTNGKLHLKDSTYADYSVSDFKTAMSGVYLVYELSTPVTYSLTPVEVETLLGVNNLWSDTGDIALTYRADTKKYIDSKIAELSAAITALGT